VYHEPLTPHEHTYSQEENTERVSRISGQHRTDLYSYRRASIGSTRVALRAGT
jgi:hypothetical protein